MVETLNTLWYIFLNVGVVFLIFVLVYTFIGTIYNLFIGNKKKEKEYENAKKELIDSLDSLLTELEKCECESKKKKVSKKGTKKAVKKESE